MATPASQRLPTWLKRGIPTGEGNRFTAGVIRRLGLATVCQHARCPNRLECYGQKTATFMILGEVCTRGCAFCAVGKGTPGPLDPDEPRRVAAAVAELGLRHVVLTSVTRDDLPDGGAEHFCKTVHAVRQVCSATVEVLPSDLGGNTAALDRLLDAGPDVYNHNTETVPRLYRQLRTPRADYRWTLAMFRRIAGRNPGIRTKTGLMLGLGETREELLETLAELAAAGCGMLTLGQYLRPSPAQTPVVRYVPPAEFDELARLARSLGFRQVAAGPLVRSSYHARQMAEASGSTSPHGAAIASGAA